MNDKDYLDADYEVIGMVNRGHGSRLPSRTLTFIPTERVEHMEALDRRIQQIQRALPFVSAAALVLAGLAIGRML